jgi:Concanavalin A-like lectin/glucanases superfamily/Secretion system C-terminal sorting domain
MKYSFVALIAFFALKCNSSVAQSVHPSGISNCIARYTFTCTDAGVGALPDASGNGHDATTVNAISCSNGFRPGSSAGNFNGTSSYAEIASSVDLAPSDITVVALIRFNGFNSGTCQGNNIIYKGFDHSNDFDWALYTSDSPFDNSCLVSSPTKQQLNYISPNASANTLVPTGNYIENKQWYMMAASHKANGNKSVFQVKMDSVVKATSISAAFTGYGPTVTDKGHDMYIGKTINPPYPYYVKGDIDEIVIFDRALSDTEMYDLYSYFWGPAPASLSSLHPSSNLVSVYAKDNGVAITNNNSSEWHYTIVNMQGQLVQKGDVKNSNTLELKANLPSGIYVVNVMTPDGIVSKKVSL